MERLNVKVRGRGGRKRSGDFKVLDGKVRVQVEVHV